MNDDNVTIMAKLKTVMSEAGAIAMEHWKKGVKFVKKGAFFETVTVADTEVERFLKAWLKENFPNDSIVAEESGGDPSRVFWSIDPVDGTNAFGRGLKDWSISIARFVDGEPVLGITYCPPTGEMFHAIKGKGAFLNGVPIHVSEVTSHEDSLVNIGQDVVRMWNRTDVDQEVSEKTASTYMIASTALALARLAEGKVTEAVQMKQCIWDIAVAMLLVSEAGGLARTWDNSPWDFSGGRENNCYFSCGRIPQDFSFLSK